MDVTVPEVKAAQTWTDPQTLLGADSECPEAAIAGITSPWI